MRIRRRLALLLLGALMLTGCAGAGPGSPASEGADRRTVTHELGPIELPARPTRVVALDEYAALNLMAVDVRPVAVFGGLSSQSGAAVLGARGVPVTPAPTMIANPDVEAIAAQRPDVIVLTSSGSLLQKTHPLLSNIAPTLVLPFEGEWRASIDLVGAAFDRTERSARIVSVLSDRIAALRRATEAMPRRVSVLASFQGLLYTPAPANPGSRLLAEAGLGRPAAQLAEASGASASTVPVSAENLGAHDADVVVVFGGSLYDAEAVTRVPTFGSLSAVRAGRTARAEGEMWSGGTALATWWMLDDLDALVAGGTGLGQPADALDRATALEDAVK